MANTGTNTNDLDSDYEPYGQVPAHRTYINKRDPVVSQTDRTSTVAEEDAYILKERQTPNAPVIKASPALQKLDEVSAVVIREEENTVLCEIDLQRGPLNVSLPKSLFPTQITYGMPITVSYKEDHSGIIRPMVSLREIQENDARRQENDEMDALVESF